MLCPAACLADWVFNYHFSNWGAIWLLGSCSLAVLVNASQFLCLGRFSAVSFQVGGLADDWVVGGRVRKGAVCRPGGFLEASIRRGSAAATDPAGGGLPPWASIMRLLIRLLLLLRPACSQVLGHMKTIMVLLGGWLFLGDSITSRKLGGMSLAVLGMVW